MPRQNNKRKNDVAFRQKKNENRLGMTMGLIAIVMVAVAVSVNSHSLKNKQQQLIDRENELQILIEQERLRTEEICELETYSKTKKFAEEIAKEKLGLVYENQIIFKEND